MRPCEGCGGAQGSFLKLPYSGRHVQLPFLWGIFPPWTSSAQEEAPGAHVVTAPPGVVQVPGPRGGRAGTALGAFAFLMVCTFPGKFPSFCSQGQFVPSLQLESDPAPLPGSGRWGSPERGHWAGWLPDGEVGGQPLGKRRPWAGNDQPAAETCKEALPGAPHRGEGKQMNRIPPLNSKAEEPCKGTHRGTMSSVAWWLRFGYPGPETLWGSLASPQTHPASPLDQGSARQWQAPWLPPCQFGLGSLRQCSVSHSPAG